MGKKYNSSKKINKNDSYKSTEEKTNSRSQYRGNNSKGGRRRGPSNDGYKETPKSVDRSSSLNDLTWYSKNPELLMAAGQIPFVQRPAMSEVYNFTMRESNGTNKTKKATLNHPGVLTMRFVPTVGVADNAIDPINISMREMYARVRSKFSGDLSITPPDLMMYVLALDSMHMYIAHLKRIYRTITTYSSNNYDYPENILRGFGFVKQKDREMLRTHRTELWGMINTMVHQVNKWVLPQDMSILHRHRWMCEHVYLDSPNVLGQTYVFCPSHLYCIQDKDTYTKLILTPIARDYDDIKALWDLMYNTFADWSGSYIINGYLQRAYESSVWYQAGLLLESERLDPAYVPEVLVQIENLRVVPVDTDSLWIEEDVPNALLTCHPSFSINDGTFADLPIRVNLYSVVPNPGEVTIATRLTPTIELADPTGTLWNVTSCGTEIVTSLTVTYGVDGSGGQVPQILIAPQNDMLQMQLVDIMSKVMWFDHHPTMYVIGGYQDSEVATVSTIGTMENTSLVPDRSMIDLHRVCIQSEFNCFN